MEPNVQDLEILHKYFRKHPKVYLRGIEGGWLKYLLDLQKFNFKK